MVVAYCEVLYPLWVMDSLRTLKVHLCLCCGYHWLALSTIDLVVDNRKLRFGAYFEVLYPL